MRWLEALLQPVLQRQQVRLSGGLLALLQVVEQAGQMADGRAQLEVRRQDVLALADQQGKVNDIFQLAGIAGPVVGLQVLLGTFADQWQRQLEALRVEAEEVLGHRQDIANPLAQWRQGQARLAQVVVEGLVELAGGYRLSQINAGGGQ